MRYVNFEEVDVTPLTRKEAIKRNLIKASEYLYRSEEGYVVTIENYTRWIPKDLFDAESFYPYQDIDNILDFNASVIRKLIPYIGSMLSDGSLDKFDSYTKSVCKTLYCSVISFNKFLVGTSDSVKSGKVEFTNMNFSQALEFIKEWFPLRRKYGMDNGVFVTRQVPAHIVSDVIPKMQSLPDMAKSLILDSAGFVNYTDQCLIYNKNTGRADSWTPSISDIFAEDWEIVSPDDL